MIKNINSTQLFILDIICRRNSKDKAPLLCKRYRYFFFLIMLKFQRQIKGFSRPKLKISYIIIWESCRNQVITIGYCWILMIYTLFTLELIKTYNYYILEKQWANPVDL